MQDKSFEQILKKYIVCEMGEEIKLKYDLEKSIKIISQKIKKDLGEQ